MNCAWGVGAEGTFLHAQKRTIQRDLDIQEYTNLEHNPMIPHPLVLEPGMQVRGSGSGSTAGRSAKRWFG